MSVWILDSKVELFFQDIESTRFNSIKFISKKPKFNVAITAQSINDATCDFGGVFLGLLLT